VRFFCYTQRNRFPWNLTGNLNPFECMYSAQETVVNRVKNQLFWLINQKIKIKINLKHIKNCTYTLPHRIHLFSNFKNINFIWLWCNFFFSTEWNLVYTQNKNVIKFCPILVHTKIYLVCVPHRKPSLDILLVSSKNIARVTLLQTISKTLLVEYAINYNSVPKIGKLCFSLIEFVHRVPPRRD